MLELTLPADAAARLLRHPAVAAARLGRPRRRQEVLHWLDDAAGTLAAAGLLLESGRPPARLRQCLPAPGQAWCPGTPAPTATPPAPPTWDPGLALPLASLVGRRNLLALADGVELELLQGHLRAGGAEQPIAQLRLSGAAPAVLALAQLLAADLPLLPGPDLAEQARALALGEAPRPRCKGAARVAAEATLEAAVAGIIGHLLEVMLYQAPRCRADASAEGVHQLRVALRRLRSALKNCRPALRCPAVEAFDRDLAALARRLGPARDWDVFLAGLGAQLAATLPAERRVRQLLTAAEARRQAAYAALRETLDGPGFRRLVLEGVALVALRPWRAAAQPAPLLDQPAAAFGAQLLEKRWHRLRAEGEAIETLDAEALHELRLGCKRLRYAAELFAPLWPGKAAPRFLRRLAQVQDRLGDANDRAVARALVAGLRHGTPAAGPWAVGLAEGLALGGLGNTRRQVLKDWEKLRDTKRFWHGP